MPQSAAASAAGGVKTDEKKQHFDDIYAEPSPVPYKTRILDALSYVSDDFNGRMFADHVLPWAVRATSHGPSLSKSAAAAGHRPGGGRRLRHVDLCGCFGNTTLATVYGMGYEDIRRNWADEESCMDIKGVRHFPVDVTGIDISAPALAYGKSVGLYDDTICADLNMRDTEEFERVKEAAGEADILLSTAALVYLDLETIEAVVTAFAEGGGSDDDGSGSSGEGYVLVNFLNPFAPEKANATKRILLDRLDFVGSGAARHRRMSELERDNFPDFGEWSLLEVWVLKRRVRRARDAPLGGGGGRPKIQFELPPLAES